MNETPLSEIMNMISQQERVNILMGEDIDAAVSFNLYDVTVQDAIEAIANAAGYAVERRDGNYFIIERQELRARQGPDPSPGLQRIKEQLDLGVCQGEKQSA